MPKLVSFNTNGIRSRQHQLEALKARHDPDVIGIQESKVADDAFPVGMIESLGYVPNYHGQKGHYGVALLSKERPRAVFKGFPTDEDDAQRRAITGIFGLPDGKDLTVIDGYFPQGESRDHPTKFPNKRRFYADLAVYLRQQFRPDQNLVLMGDMNVAPLDADIGIGADNAKRWLKTGKCSFLPEERDWLKVLTDWGLYDAYRVVHPDVDDRFSWFDYRSRGFEREPKHGLRIDLILVTAPIRERLRDADIDYDIRALEKPSDHCPVWIEIE
jgi:exodeoxyribonuclease-3